MPSEPWPFTINITVFLCKAHNIEMKIFAFLTSLALCQPLKDGTKQFCTATCTGETDDWATYSSNGVKTKGKIFAIRF